MSLKVTRFSGPRPNLASTVGGDPSAPPGSDPTPTDPGADPIDRASDAQGGYAVSLSTPGTPAVVQYGTDVGFSTFLASVSLPAPATAGNLLMLVMGDRTNDVADMNVPAGFAILTGLENDFAAVNPHGHLVAAKVAAGGEQVISFNNSTPSSAGAPEAAAIIEYSGFGGVVPDVDTVAVADRTADGTPEVPSITPTSAIRALIIAFVHKVTANPNPGPATLSGYTPVVDSGYQAFGLRHRLTLYSRFETSTTGSYGGVSTSDSGAADDSNIIHAALEAPAEPAWNAPAPGSIDGDDATYDTITGTDLLRVDLGAPFRIVSTRIRIATTNAGSRTLTIKGANAADFSDEVTLGTIVFTATGSLTAQDVEGSWSNLVEYQYYELSIGTSDTFRIHAWELYEPEVFDPAEIDAHIADTSDAHDAAAISFSPVGTIAATDVQAAVAEVASEAATDLTNHTGDATDAHDASAISVLDTGGNFTATDVEAALAELAGSISGGGIPATIVDAAGDIIVGTADDTVARLAAGSEDDVLTIVSGVPAWAAPTGGSGGDVVPTAIQFGANAINGTSLGVTISAAASGNRLIVGVLSNARDVNTPTCTNTTFTEVLAVNSGTTVYLSIYVGVVAGGSSGTTVTITATGGNFIFAEVVEVADALTPTAGATQTAAGPTQGIVYNITPTAGTLWIAATGQSNNTTPYLLGITGPYTSRAPRTNNAMAMAIGYASGTVGAYTFGATSGTVLIGIVAVS
jgi:hypothetical protein